jgi:hypothetical protein
MRSFIFLLIPLCFAFGAASVAQDRTAARFTSVDIFVDPIGQPLAAYQLELNTTAGDVTIVGIEGSDVAAFNEPPYYDPAAMQSNRVILAAFNTAAAKDLPKIRTRVARVHVRVAGAITPTYSLSLTVAASPDAKPIANAKASLQEGAGS